MLNSLLSRITDRFEAPGFYTFVNPYSYCLLRKNKKLVESMDGIGIDGISLVIILRMLRLSKVKRVSFDMSSLPKVLFPIASENGRKIFLIGSTADNMKQAVKNLAYRYPNMEIVGFRHGYFNDAQEWDLSISQIIALSPNIIVVGMGTPKQEQYLVALKAAGYRGFAFTCGGFFHQTAKSLDYYPKWMDSIHMRWLFRIIMEPHLWKRYFIEYPKFIWFFLIDLITSSPRRR